VRGNHRFRSLRLSGIKAGGRLGFYGFGAAAHVADQVARHWRVEVYASTRTPLHSETGAWSWGRVDGRKRSMNPQETRRRHVFAASRGDRSGSTEGAGKGGVSRSWR